VLSVSPATLAFKYQHGVEPSIWTKFLTVASEPQQTPYTVVVSAGGDWLTAVADTGSTPDTVAVSVRTDLNTGIYYGSLTITAGAFGSAVVGVTLTVSETRSQTCPSPPRQR